MLLVVLGSGEEGERDALLEMIGRGTLLLLVHGACKFAADEGFCREARRRGVKLFALREDLEEGGLLDRKIDCVEVVDYDGWVKLLEGCESVFSWL